MKIRTIIVDDEPLAREGVRFVLVEEADVEIVAECADGAQAVRAIEEHRPDLVFLDVQMPHLNGFDVLAALDPDKMPAVIFTTAHDEHAIAAFEINAVDYLLKPFKPERLQKALQRARDQLKKTASSGAEPHLAPMEGRLASAGFMRISRSIIINLSRIRELAPMGAGEYCVILKSGGRFDMTCSLSELQERLGKL